MHNLLSPQTRPLQRLLDQVTETPAKKIEIAQKIVFELAEPCGMSCGSGRWYATAGLLLGRQTAWKAEDFAREFDAAIDADEEE